MVLCKYFQQGNCHFQERCRFQHPGAGRPGDGPALGGGNRQNTISGPSDGTSQKPNYGIRSVDIRDDLTAGKGRPQWILSTYGPGRNAPSSLLEGHELSFEEMRLRFYELAAQGKQNQALEEANGLWSRCETAIQEVLNNVDNVTKYEEEAERKHPNRLDLCKMDGTKPVEQFKKEIESQASSTAGATGSNPFSRPTTSTGFGQPSTGFGQPAGLGTGIFGKPTVGGFGQPAQPGAFGQPSQPQSSTGFGQPSQPSGFGAPAFGQPSQPAFGQPSQPSQPAFGQPSQPSQPAFGQPSQPSQGAFGKPSQPAFGQPSQPSQPAFGQPSQPSQPAFGQPTQPSQPAFGQPSQPSQPAFGQPSQPSQPAFGQPSQPSQPAFGQPSQPSQPAFGQPTQPSQPAFGQPSQPAFGQPQTAFGKPAFGQPSQSSGFGQPSALGAGSGGGTQPAFGQPSAPTSGFGKPAFGAPATTVAPAFGTPSQPTGFGQPSQPQNSAAPPSAFGKPAASASNPFSASSTAPSFGTATSIAAPVAKPAQPVQSTTSFASPAASGAIHPLTGKPAVAMVYTETLPNIPPTTQQVIDPMTRKPKTILVTYRGCKVVYKEDKPYYQRPDGKGLERIFFPDGEPGFKPEEVAVDKNSYTDEVINAYKYLFEHGDFEPGKPIPMVPPLPEWASFDF